MLQTLASDRPLRNLLLSCLLLGLLLPAGALLVVHPRVLAMVEGNARSHAVQVASHLARVLIPGQVPLGPAGLPPGFSGQCRDAMQDFGLAKVKLYAANGRVVFSTVAAEIGRQVDQDFFFLRVAKGEVISQAVHRGEPSLEGQRLPARVMLETYVPLQRQGRFRGAFEIYADISDQIHQLKRLLTLAFISLTLTILIFWAALGFTFAQARRQRRQRQRLETDLAGTKAFLESVMNGIPEPIMTIAPDYRVTWMNRAARQQYGMTAPGAPPPHCYKLFHQSDEPCAGEDHFCPLQTVLETREPVRATHTHGGRAGEQRTYEILASPLFDRQGRVAGIIESGRDQTERLRLEEELRKSENLKALGTLAGGIAHDFNNLLTSILGNITLGRRLASDPQCLAALDSAAAASRYAADLTGQLLSFARGTPPQQVEIDLAPLVRETARITVNHSQGVWLRFQFPEQLWPVTGDPVQLRQVIGNLIQNAMEAMPKGGAITISGENLAVPPPSLPLPHPDHPHLRITVQDQGQGIPDTIRLRIFEPYFSGKPKDSHKGRGLGLAICHTIIKQHQGLITVSSRPGKGTTFQIYLPARRQEP